MSNATSTPEAGQILAGKYLVEEVLGVGGMGVVVAAKHLQLDQRVAIKYLLPAALLNGEVVERFAREARAAAKIRSEHVARVIDVGQFDDGAPFMVLEYLEGHDLAKQLEDHGALTVEDAVRWVLETCEALAEAHAAKIVHRDLKPSNLFLSKQPDKSTIIKVLDFGISKTGDAPSASLTKTSALMGTAFYMSPEQLTNPKGVDHRSDIWSLGVILYELLSGQQPFLGESVPEIIGGILQNEPASIRTHRPEVPFGLEVVIGKCMQSKAAARYQSVAALAAALGPYARASDRMSIDITARILGETVAPALEPVADTSPATLMLSGGAQSGAAPQSRVGEAAGPAPIERTAVSAKGGAAGDGAAAPVVPVGAVTTHGLSTSAITPKPKRSPAALIAGVVAVAFAIGGTVAGIKLAGKTEAPNAAGSGLVSPPKAAEAPPSAAASNLAPATILGAINPAPPENALPAVPVTAATQQVAAAAHTNTPAAAVAAGPRTPGARVPPAKSAAPLASALPPATPVAPVTPSSTSSKNPLQMGIK
jgi:serine/threonine-protein kinase